MAIDYDAVRAGMEQAIPFNKHLGLEILSVAVIFTGHFWRK